MGTGLSPAVLLIHFPYSTVQIVAHKAWRASRAKESAKLGLPRYLLNKGEEVWIERDRLNRNIIHRI